MKSYGKFKVLKGINLNVQEGEFVGIMGKSGSGKTTLLKILGLIESVTDGALLYKKDEISKLSDKELARIRREELGLDDVDLEIAVSDRLYAKCKAGEPENSILQDATETQRIYYVLHRYGMMIGEKKEHGEYSVEKNRELIPLLIPAMEKVGAVENKELLMRFADRYNLYLDDLDIEQFHRLKKMKNENKQSPVEEFKEAYYDLMGESDELDTCLMAYIRQHLEEV